MKINNFGTEIDDFDTKIQCEELIPDGFELDEIENVDDQIELGLGVIL